MEYGAMMARTSRRATWSNDDVRAWIARNGGNLTALARRLDVPRTLLQKWVASKETHRDARDLPPYIQAHMQTMDGLQAWLARWGEVIPAEARAELEAVLRNEPPTQELPHDRD